jgi:hypothetical protein
MRSLFLHVSALNDDEYTLFTSSFADLVAPDPPLQADDDFEKLAVSIREARAWLRGRYPDLPVSDLDQVCISLSRLHFSHHLELDLAPVPHKSRTRRDPYQGPVLCHPSSCLTCPRRSRVRQKPRL